MAAEDRGPQVAGVAILFLILSWIFVSLRCYVRAVMIKNFGTDDWFAVASLVGFSFRPSPLRLATPSLAEPVFSQILFTLYCTFVLKGVEYGYVLKPYYPSISYQSISDVNVYDR